MASLKIASVANDLQSKSRYQGDPWKIGKGCLGNEVDLDVR